MSGKDTKLIFLDIDGTLVQPGENTPPESAVQAIRAAQTKKTRRRSRKPVVIAL